MEEHAGRHLVGSHVIAPQSRRPSLDQTVEYYIMHVQYMTALTPTYVKLSLETQNTSVNAPLDLIALLHVIVTHVPFQTLSARIMMGHSHANARMDTVDHNARKRCRHVHPTLVTTTLCV